MTAEGARRGAGMSAGRHGGKDADRRPELPLLAPTRSCSGLLRPAARVTGEGVVQNMEPPEWALSRAFLFLARRRSGFWHGFPELWCVPGACHRSCVPTALW